MPSSVENAQTVLTRSMLRVAKAARSIRSLSFGRRKDRDAGLFHEPKRVYLISATCRSDQFICIQCNTVAALEGPSVLK